MVAHSWKRYHLPGGLGSHVRAAIGLILEFEPLASTDTNPAQRGDEENSDTGVLPAMRPTPTYRDELFVASLAGKTNLSRSAPTDAGHSFRISRETSGQRGA